MVRRNRRIEDMSRGQIGEVEKGTGCFHRVTWRIPNFMLLFEEEENTYYSSPHFYFLNLRWCLRIYPNDKFRGREWIGIYLERSSHGPPQTVDCIFGIRKADGMEEHFYHFKRENVFSREASVWGRFKFLQRSELRTRESELAPLDALTIVCILSSNVADQTLISRETQTEDLADGIGKEEFCALHDTKGGAILLKHFQDLHLNSEDHDVTLKVKDQEFKAHKNILRARSPVFAAMFAHNMAENECGEVCIDDCEPNAFCEFLKYVYVGKFENMPPATAVNLCYIADKYDFPDLKKTCVEFLKASLTTNVICDVVPLAIKHGEDQLLECAMEFFSKHMVETFMTVEWQSFITSNAILANELTIKAMKISHKSSE